MGLGVMNFPVGSYVIFYQDRDAEGRSYIPRILHGRRDIPCVFR
ncbi:MAG: type II toxin-antitoxin system RelE/ParE family toxin [Gemmatimonas sp.]